MEERSGGGGGDRERNERVKNAAPSEECPQTRTRAGPNTDSLVSSEIFNTDRTKIVNLGTCLVGIVLCYATTLQGCSRLEFSNSGCPRLLYVLTVIVQDRLSTNTLMRSTPARQGPALSSCAPLESTYLNTRSQSEERILQLDPTRDSPCFSEVVDTGLELHRWMTARPSND